MDYNNIAIMIGVLAAIFIAAKAALKYRNENSLASSFFFGSKELSASDSSRSLFASWMSFGNVIVGAIIITVSYQILAIWPIITWVLGFFILAGHAPKILKEASPFPTMYAFLKSRFKSQRIGRFCAILGISTAIGVLALELIVGSSLFFLLGLEISPILLICITTFLLALIVSLYTYFGGLSAVIATDRIQTLAIIAGIISLVVLVAFMPASGIDQESVGDAVAKVIDRDPPVQQGILLVMFFIGFGAFQLFLLLGDFSTWQRIQICSSQNSARMSAISAGIGNLIAWGLLMAVGLLILKLPIDLIYIEGVSTNAAPILQSQAEPFTSLLKASSSTLPGPLYFILLMIISFGLFSAILSTCDSFLIVAIEAYLFEFSKVSSLINTRDKLKNESDIDKKLAVTAKKLIPLVMALAVILFSLTLIAELPLVSVIFFVFSLQCIISPIAIFALYFPTACKKIESYIYWSIWISVLGIFALFILAGATSGSISYAISYGAPVVGILVPLVAIIIGSLRHGLFYEARSIILRLFLPGSLENE